MVWICCRFINLVYCKYNRNAGGRSVVYGLYGLRHNIIISGYNDNGNICDLGTTGTHSGERLVTWSIKECDMLSVLKLNVISTDVLCNTTSLTSNNVSLTNIVKQRCFTVVNVTHDSYNRSTWNHILWLILLLMDALLNLSTDILGLEAKLVCHNVYSLSIKTLVNGNEQAEIHTCAYNLCYWNTHHGGKVIYSYKLCNLDGLVLQTFCFSLSLHTLMCCLTLILTILS